MSRGYLERPKLIPGINVRIALADYSAKDPDEETPLANAQIHLIPLVTVHCEGCGAELQIPERLHVYACPEDQCRGMFWFPCEVCKEDKRKCKGGQAGKCLHDNGRYIEAVKITRGGAR